MYKRILKYYLFSYSKCYREVKEKEIGMLVLYLGVVFVQCQVKVGGRVGDLEV